MPLTDWKTLRNQVVDIPDRLGQRIPSPTDSDIEEFEKAASIKLPHSYREFVTVFGPGELMSAIDIYSPNCARLNPTWDLQAQHSEQQHRIQQNLLQHCTDNVCAILEGWFIFARDINSHQSLGWDLKRVTDSKSNEYAIYEYFSRSEICPKGSTLFDVVQALLDEGLPEDWDEDELGPWLCFRPATYGN